MTTQKAFASYQEIIDLHTESDKVSVIGIHTPTSDTPRKMFGGFFDQFKKFKYLGCSISLVPAARLPADPLQVSAIYDEESPFQSIDPRDMLNPIMFHGCHGNDMGVILNRLYALNSLTAKRSDSVFQVEDMGELSGDTPVDEISGFQLDDLYYKALTDNTWKKAHPQRGFRKSGLRPLVYTMATNMQFLANGGLGNMGIPTQPEFEIGGSAGSETVIGNFGISQANRQFFTPRLTGLGWLDTRNVMTTTTFSDEVALENDFQNVYDMIDEGTQAQESLASLPLVYMGMILMPPAYKQEQYFRMIVNHHFAFKEFRGISFSNVLTESPAYTDFNIQEESEDDSGGDTGGGITPDPDDPTPDDPTPDDPDTPTFNGAYVSSLSTIGSDPVYLELYDTVNGSPVKLVTYHENGNGGYAGIFLDQNAVPHPVSYVAPSNQWRVWKDDATGGLGWYTASTLAAAMASTSRASLNWDQYMPESLVTYTEGEGVKSRLQQICNGTETVQVLS